jgi:serine/threonine protein kinase
VADSPFDPTRSPPLSANFAFAPLSPVELQREFPQVEIIELLGKGGMGAVYKARQVSLDRIVAVKVLPREVGQDPTFAERFTREARALAKLSHPHIVTIHDFGRTAGGLFYFIMEFIDGPTLRQATHDGKIDVDAAKAIVSQTCDALQFAHDAGVVHRDIKPENILLDRTGRVRIADFGLARLVGPDSGEDRLTMTRQVMGTLRYMSPEQIEGAPDIDHRADIYSLGVVFYELLTGVLPLGRFAAPSERRAIDKRLDAVVLRMLEREPQSRYQRAADAKSALDSMTNVSMAPAFLTTTITPLSRNSTTNPSATAPLAEEPHSPLWDAHPAVLSVYAIWVLAAVMGVLAGQARIFGVPISNVHIQSSWGILLLAGIVAVCIYFRKRYSVNRLTQSFHHAAAGCRPVPDSTFVESGFIAAARLWLLSRWPVILWFLIRIAGAVLVFVVFANLFNALTFGGQGSGSLMFGPGLIAIGMLAFWIWLVRRFARWALTGNNVAFWMGSLASLFGAVMSAFPWASGFTESGESIEASGYQGLPGQLTIPLFLLPLAVQYVGGRRLPSLLVPSLQLGAGGVIISLLTFFDYGFWVWAPAPWWREYNLGPRVSEAPAYWCALGAATVLSLVALSQFRRILQGLDHPATQ